MYYCNSHARISRLEINAKASTPRTHQEDKIFTSRGVELVNDMIPLCPRRSPVESTVSPTTQDAIVLKNVEHRRELRKDARTMSTLKQ